MLNTLRGKVAIGYLLLASLILVVSIASINHIERLTSSINKIMAENYWSVTAAERMIMAMERQDSSVLLYLLGHEDTVGDFHASQTEFVKWLGRAEDNVTLPDEESIVSAIEDQYQEYVEAFGILRTMQNPDDRLSYYVAEMYPRLKNLEEEVEGLLRVNHESMLAARESSDELGERAVGSTIITGVLALVLAAGASFYISHLIITPTRELTELVRNIEPGNVGNLEAAEKPGEMGELAREVNAMMSRLRSYDERIIAQLQSQRERSRAIVESITDGILVVDEQYHLRIANQTGRRLFGISPNRIRGHILERIGDDRVFEAVKTSVDEAEIVELHGPENRWVCQEGDRRRYYELAVSPVVRDDGAVVGAVANFRDVTHYHEVDEMKTDFMSTVTHEFRTPLTSLSLNAALLAEKVREAEACDIEDLDEISDEMASDSERLLELVNNLLDLSRVESGSMTMDMEPVALKQLLDQVLDPFWRQAEDGGVCLAVAELDEVPRVMADPAKIGWVISNLVGNALRYTDAGGTVTVSAQEKGTRVAISVEDTGVGISKEAQDRIFDKFVQAGEGTRRGGAGLGLAICREIVRAHGENIWVESEPGEGSTFTFTLSRAG